MLERPRRRAHHHSAALAAQLELSEAALYRHFRSKAQMFEALIEFIESSIFGLVNQICEREEDARVQAAHSVIVLLQFAERNPGMTRVMVATRWCSRDPRPAQRMNQFFDRIESQSRQSMRRAGRRVRGSAEPTVEAAAQASALTCFCIRAVQRSPPISAAARSSRSTVALQMMIHGEPLPPNDERR